MEIKITFLVSDDIDLMDYSASAMELGSDAGKITWENSKEAGFSFFKTTEEKEEIKDYFKDFGAWEDDEIEAWSDTEINALLLQFISGNLREYLAAKAKGPEKFKHWDENCGGRIFESCNDFYIYIGN